METGAEPHGGDHGRGPGQSGPKGRATTRVAIYAPEDRGPALVRLIRFCGVLIAGLEVCYIVYDWRWTAGPAPLVSALHIFNIAVGIAVFFLSKTAWFARWWREATLFACIALLLSTLVICCATRDAEALFITVLLTLMGTAALLPWGVGCQAILTMAGVTTMLAGHLLAFLNDPASATHLTGLAAGAGLAYAVAMFSAHYREEIAAQLLALREGHERLGAEATRREAAIAELREAEQRVRESEAALRTIFEASLDAITINRLRDCSFVDFNARFALTFAAQGGPAAPAAANDLHLWADAEARKEFRRRLLEDGFVHNMEADLRVRAGRLVPFLLSAAIAELHGERCVVTALRDITELRKARDELIALREAALAASRAKSEFLTSMSHEIRAPMNAVLGMADLLLDTPLTPEQRRYLDLMRTNGHALLTLVDGILDLAKVESGRLSLERTAFDLNELVETVLETLGLRAYKKGLELAARVSSDVPATPVGDPLRLRQILINLLGNAIKFTQAGEVTLNVERAEPGGKIADLGSGGTKPGTDHETAVQFSVADTGIGIPPDKLEAVFSPFTQADSTTTRKYGGSGLGLAIVKRLVELMHGTITVESEVGRGSTFTLAIPFPAEPEGRARLSGDFGAPAHRFRIPDLGGLRALVADDAAINRTVVGELLAGLGALVDEAADGERALAQAAWARQCGAPYGLVVVDARMAAGPDGAEVARQLVAGEAGSNNGGETGVVLMLTPEDLNRRLVELSDLGLMRSARFRYLVKPVRRSELFETVAAVMSGQPAPPPAAMEPCGTGPAAEPGDGGAEQAPDSARTLHLLVAEDSRDNLALIRAYLKKFPCRIDHAENGQAAVEKFTSGSYDVVLMDIQMPVLGGHAAIAAMRRWERERGLRPTPIIALSAAAHDEAVRKSLATGGDIHVTKPVRRGTLLEAIRQAVAKSDRERAAQPARVVVELDAELSDLVPGFLKRKRDDAAAILEAIQRADLGTIARLGHKLKGEGGSFGLDAITELGAALERAAARRDLEASRQQAVALRDFLERLEVVYRH